MPDFAVSLSPFGAEPYHDANPNLIKSIRTNTEGSYHSVLVLHPAACARTIIISRFKILRTCNV